MQPIPVNGPDDIIFLGNLRRSRSGVRAAKEVTAESSSAIMATSHDDSECSDCKSKKQKSDKRLAAMQKQLDVLASFSEALLEENAGNLRQEKLEGLRRNLQRVVGGTITPFGQFNHCVAIGDPTDWFCTGALVHPRVVLTAAHCADNISRVFVGGRQISDLGSGQVIGVEKVFVHPDYRKTQIPSHDICVLLLSADAQEAPIALAETDIINKETSMVLVGFGSDDPNGLTGFGTKRYADAVHTFTSDLPAQEIERLQSLHGFHNTYEFHTGRKGLGIDTCYGDSGGPAYTKDENAGGAIKLAGLTSRGAFSIDVDCGDGGIYTRVNPYLSWISRVTNGLIGGQRVDEDQNVVSGLYISAAMPNPPGPDLGNEWVEITNGTNQLIDLNGLTLSDKQGGQLKLSGMLANRQSLRIVLPANSSVKLSNSGDEIILKSGLGVVHQVSYPSSGSGQVLTFNAPIVDHPNGNDTGGAADDNRADPC